MNVQRCPASRAAQSSPVVLCAGDTVGALHAMRVSPLRAPPEALDCHLSDDFASPLAIRPMAAWALGSVVFETLTLRPFLCPSPAREVGGRSEASVVDEKLSALQKWVRGPTSCALTSLRLLHVLCYCYKQCPSSAFMCIAVLHCPSCTTCLPEACPLHMYG